jgi:outer membrane protein
MKSSLLKSTLAAAGLALALAATGACGQELKIGYVNSDVLLREALPAKAASAKLQAEFDKREKALGEMGNRLKTAGDKFEKDQPTLAEPDKVRRQRELIEQDREFQRKRREFQEDLNQRRNEETASLMERANKAIKQIAEQERYDLIVAEAFYNSPRIDITEKVIKVLNAQGGK